MTTKHILEFDEDLEIELNAFGLSDWETTNNPIALMSCIKQCSIRKLRLYVAACCDYAYDRSELLKEDCISSFQSIINSAILLADGIITYEQFNIVLDTLIPKIYLTNDLRNALKNLSLLEDSDLTVLGEVKKIIQSLIIGQDEEVFKRYTDYFRDLFPSPLSPLRLIDKSWMVQNVIDIATTIYDRNEYSSVPILGDAIEEAYCDDRSIIDHCRKPNHTHIKGCWVIDLILGKDRIN